ncbi:MAG TPA: HK97 gp10 family phage protein [Acidimicrobiales bacterium]|nr:HK97 gp10 family phage protein [Acidimicrobiales bacterium]
MPITVTATVAGLTILGSRFEEATRQITADAAHIVQARAMVEAPVGTPGNSTNYPGDLRRSIDVQGPYNTGGEYVALVGPTVIYGRQRELGGNIYPKAATLLRFTKFGQTVFTSHVYQHPNPYMLRGEMASLPAIEAVVYARLAAVIEET